jgi:hypothetical protein
MEDLPQPLNKPLPSSRRHHPSKKKPKPPSHATLFFPNLLSLQIVTSKRMKMKKAKMRQTRLTLASMRKMEKMTSMTTLPQRKVKRTTARRTITAQA